MSQSETLCTISPTVKPMICTRAADREVLASQHATVGSGVLTWHRVIDEYLVEWGRTVERLQDEGLTPPTPKAIEIASRIAIDLRDQGAPAPTRVAPDGDGGIVFERRARAISESIEINGDGTAELLVLANSKLSLRKQLI